MSNLKIKDLELKRMIYATVIPLMLIISFWIVKLIEVSFNISFAKYGIYPQRLSNLVGIILSPFIHSDFSHLFSNTIPFLFLGSLLFYFYRKNGLKIFLIIYIATGFWVWLAARSSYHIGASGIVYGLAAFLSFSGFIHKSKSLIAISLLVVFLYGSMVWGVLPLKEEVSWESHLYGGITGIILAFGYGKTQPITTKVAVPKSEFKDFENYSITNNNFSGISYNVKEKE